MFYGYLLLYSVLTFKIWFHVRIVTLCLGKGCSRPDRIRTLVSMVRDSTHRVNEFDFEPDHRLHFLVMIMTYNERNVVASLVPSCLFLI